MKGRGTEHNPPNRFDKLHHEPGFEEDREHEEERPGPRTEFFRDNARSIIAENDSPDIPFDRSLNPYRGCEHGCVYCYARPNHEHLGFSAGLDFETKILVKEDAPELLRASLLKPSWKPEFISLSGVTDPYQPVERKLRLTRRCLEVLTEFRNPFGIITKNHMVTRDIDLLAEMASLQAACVNISITTLDADLCGKLEPRTSRPSARLEAIRLLSAAGVPTTVMLSPMIPGLTDHEMPRILEAAAEAGARWAAFIPVRLPGAVAPLFESWLETHYPDRKDKVLNHIRSIRGGKLYEPKFGNRMTGSGPWADHLRQTFHVFVRKYGLNRERLPLATDHFRRPGEQMRLF